ncbi:PREDICTED: uncharacterized protein LOC106786663 [Polistes canadensis]|uniref:uncharacterized protein LOC106786663 n=1 Tax=Polistes canadensis TaxID=91411 RepID=UPI000718FEA3|nr:PREDICTED: uncharacterized protein LOC106786663 [Polistes canadensis]
MTSNSCKSTKDEQLFTLEVFVNDVTLYIDKLQKKELTDLGIDLKFIDFPLIRIFQNEYELTKMEKSKEIRSDAKCRIINFNCGQTHLFPRIPSELINAMRASKLTLDVYKIKGISICPYQVLKDPLGKAEIPLHGCLCDQFTMATNDTNYMPKPYVIKNKFILLNEEHMLSGMVALFLRLQYIGKHTTVEFAIDEKTLLFKNQNFPDEYRCTRVPIYDEILIRAQEREKKICFPDEKLEPNEIDLPPNSNFIIDLTQICTMLAERDKLPKDLFYSLKTQCIDKYDQINDKEEENNPWPSEKFIIDTSTSNVHIRSHLGNRPCYTVGCSGGLCIGGNSTWENTKYL